MLYPKIGIRPVIDGRWGGVRESLENQTIAAHKKGISLESKRKRHPGKGRKDHHDIGRCFGARLDLPKAIAKGDDICALRHIKSDDKQGDQ